MDKQIRTEDCIDQEWMVEAISRLVRIDSTKGPATSSFPFGEGPAKALQEALKMAESQGLMTENLENAIGIISYNNEEPLLDILCHVDVVAPGEGWSVTEPFRPLFKNGKIYGRGTSDDKGPLVAALEAMISLKKQKVSLAYNVRIILGTDEECGSEDLPYFLKEHAFAPYVFSPDAEFPLINTEKGSYRPCFTYKMRAAKDSCVLDIKGGTSVNIVPANCVCRLKQEALESENRLARLQIKAEALSNQNDCRYEMKREGQCYVITSYGKEAHASSPRHGVNAITGMLDLLSQFYETEALFEDPLLSSLYSLNQMLPHGDWLGNALGIAMEDEISGVLTLTFSLLSYENGVLKGRFDSRVPLCARESNCKTPVEKAFSERGFTIWGDMHEGHHVSEQSPFVQLLLQAYHAQTGLPGFCKSSGGGTYVHTIPGGVAFGCEMPGKNTNMHGADECVWLEDMVCASKIFKSVILDIEKCTIRR